MNSTLAIWKAVSDYTINLIMDSKSHSQDTSTINKVLSLVAWPVALMKEELIHKIGYYIPDIPKGE